MDNNKEEIKYKKCYGKYGCEKIKPIVEFGKSENSRDGYNSCCKECWNKICMFRRKGVLEELKEYIPEGYKKCKGKNSCGLIKKIEEFQLRADTGKYRNQCRSCKSSAENKWHKNNVEKTKTARNKANKKIRSKNKKENIDKNPYIKISLKKML